MYQNSLRPMTNLSNKPGGASSRGSHRLSEAVLCPRKWTLHQLYKLIPREKISYFVEGSCIHIALAHHFAKQMTVRPDWYNEFSLDLMLAEEALGYPPAIGLAKSVLTGYERHYGSKEQWTPVAIEQEYQATLNEIWRTCLGHDCPDEYADVANEVVSSRLDLLYQTADGRIWDMDYKSVGKGDKRGRLYKLKPDGEYALPWQFMLQAAILRTRFGAQFGGVVVERILKLTPHDFDREVVMMPNLAFKLLPQTLARTLRAEVSIINDVKKNVGVTGWLPSGNYWACYPYGKACEFAPYCRAESTEQQQNVLATEYTRK